MQHRRKRRPLAIIGLGVLALAGAVIAVTAGDIPLQQNQVTKELPAQRFLKTP